MNKYTLSTDLVRRIEKDKMTSHYETLSEKVESKLKAFDYFIELAGYTNRIRYNDAEFNCLKHCFQNKTVVPQINPTFIILSTFDTYQANENICDYYLVNEQELVNKIQNATPVESYALIAQCKRGYL